MRQPSNVSLPALSRQFLAHLERRLFSLWTVYARRRQVHRFLKFCRRQSVTKPTQFTRDLLKAYHHSLCEHRTTAGQPLKPATVQHLLVGVNAFLTWLVREHVLSANPMSDFEMPRKGRSLPRAVLTPGEVAIVLEQPDVRTLQGLRDRAILEVLYSTGLRRMELCRLNLSHLDSVNHLMRVEQGKGRKDRLVPISSEALGWVQRYLNKARAKSHQAHDEPALFLNLFGRRLSEQVLGSIVRRLVRRANVGKTGSCHLFRHAFATGLLRNGCDLRHIQTMLGHASLETTQLYTHLDTGQIQAAHRKFHPGERTPPGQPSRSALDQLLAEAQSLGAADLNKVVEYVGLLKFACEHRWHSSAMPPKACP